MILAVDVDYRDGHACIAGVTFENWQDSETSNSFSTILEKVNEYIPGQFYLRELPCILKLIEEHKLKPDYIVIDGYVYLDADGGPGLGKHLYEALNSKVAIIGVAKKPYKGMAAGCEIYRGLSNKPLYVTSVGMTVAEAGALIRSMHGEFRIPTLLKRADQLSRRIAV